MQPSHGTAYCGYSQEERYIHLVGLKLSDSADASEALNIDMLFGSDLYCSQEIEADS